MATTPTSIGPVGARQINHNLYVGQSDLTTIQKAVSVAANIGGLFVVVVPFDYAGSDTIAAVTGGSTSIEILDRRGAQMQSYIWSGAQYVPGTFQQATGFAAMGVPSSIPAGSASFYFDPTGTVGAGTAHLNFSANVGQGQPGFLLSGIPSDGTGLYTYYRLAFTLPGAIPGGVTPTTTVAQMEAPLQLNLFNGGFQSYNLWLGGFTQPGGKGMTVWAKAAENAIDLQGLTIGGVYDQTIRLNYLGGNVQIGPLTFDAAGNIIGIADLTADSIIAGDADFDTCEVDNSPVRTFANTPDGPGQGMVWPPDGIAVSLGDHWQDPSINPTTLATWPAAGIPVSTGTAWGTPIAAASLVTWPATGIPVSTGAAWGTPINPATLARYPGAGIPVSTGTAWGTSLAAASLATWPAAGVAVSTGSAWSTPIAPANLPLLNQANVFTQANTFGNITVNGTVIATGNIYANGPTGYVTAGPGSTDTTGTAGPAGVSPRIVLSVRGQYGASYPGQFIINTWSSASSDSNDTMDIRHMAGGGSPVPATGSLWSLTANGNMSVSGSITAASKSFLIHHPTEDRKMLQHGSIEGPEFGVYYRGEGVTDGGWAEITLPNYFEALTMPTDRSVLLTALFEDDAEQIGMLAASRVKDGRFKVWSALPTQKFYWEVKAVRSDIETLEVERDDTEFDRSVPPPPDKGEEANEEA